MLENFLIRFNRGAVFLSSAAVAVFLLAVAGCDSDPGHAGRSSSQWVEQLRSGDEAGKIEAAQSLGKVLQIRPDYPKVVAALVSALRDSSDNVRISAASALTAEGVDIRAAIDGLHEVLHDSAHADVRASAVLIVSSLGPARANALLPYLCELLDDPSPRVRAAAVDAIGHVGPAALAEVPNLSRMMRDSSQDVRESIVRALVNLGASPSVLLPVGRSALRDSSALVRAAAVEALGSMGSGAAQATDDLTVALRDSSAAVIRGALLALSSIGPAARKAIPQLKALQSNPRRNDDALIRETIARIQGQRDLARPNPEPTLSEICRGNPGDTRC